MNVEQIILAARLAEIAHRGQVRKYTGAPYITHPMRVAARVTLLPGATDDMIAAAWLHDVVEDCGVSEQAILDQFGLGIADLVVQLTAPSKAYPHLNRKERKEIDRQYLAQVPDAAKKIKLIDRIDNIREMAEAPRDFKELYVDETRLLVEAIASVDTMDLCGELDRECLKILREAK
jgi:(p)ppGpp synthase/HD superfamily hydrolase